jgi:hypothetical protein
MERRKMKKALMHSAAVLIMLAASGLATHILAKDKVKIISITPASVLVSGAEAQVEVEIEYELESKDAGEIALGFNTKRPNEFVMQEKTIVKKGKGRVTLRTKVQPVDWKDAAPFFAHVNISEYPHSEVWRTLADTQKKIKIQRR